jgi:O-antigen/teichoic acid export membrane protein
MKPGEIARAVSRGVFYLAIEKVVALLSGTLYFALLLRWMGPTKYGIITLALAFAGLATLAAGNFEVFLERYAAEYLAHGRFATLRRAHLIALSVKLALGVLAAILLAALAPWLAHQFSMPELAVLLPVLTALVITDGFATTARATLFGLQRFRWVSALAVLFHVAKTAMVGLLWWSHKGLYELAAGLAVLSLAQGALMAVVPLVMLRGGRDLAGAPTPPLELLRSMVRYCLPLLGARAAFTSGQNLGKVVLGKLLDAEHLGYFSYAFQTVERFVELFSVLSTSLLPSLTHLVARHERERLCHVFDQAFRLVQVTAMLVSVGLVVFATEITQLVASAMFLPAVPVLRILALVPLVRTAQQPFTSLFQAMRQPATVLRLALLKFVVEVVGVVVMVPAMGVPGAGWANLAGALAAFAGALVAGDRLLPEGTGERLRAVVPSLTLAAVLLAGGLAFERFLPPVPGLIARAMLFPIALVAILRLRLVTPYDFEKLASLPLSWEWLRKVRTSALGAFTRLARALEPGGVA